MTIIKSYTDIEQSKKLAEFLPLESADMHYGEYCAGGENFPIPNCDDDYNGHCCWSLTALLAILPEINGISLKIEKVKAEDGYDGYYYHIEYEGIVLIPYSKNLVDACYEMIIKLNELKML